MLFAIGWSPLMIWLNIKPWRPQVFMRPLNELDTGIYWCWYGFPWIYAGGLDDAFPSTIHLDNMVIISRWALAGDIVVGVLGLVFLTWASKHLLRQIMCVLGVKRA